MKYYRCHKVYVTKTKGERISDAVELFSQDLPITNISSTDTAIKAAAELTRELRNPTPALPFHYFGEKMLSTLDTLSEIFNKCK